MRSRVTGVLFVLLWQMPLALSGQTTSPMAVEPEPVLQVGEVLGDSPEYSFTDIAAIGVVGDSIIVLEEAAKEIRIFDHQGRFLGRIGGEGEGPREFVWPTAMRLTSEGIQVVDLGIRRQSFFSLRGELLRTVPLGHLGERALAGLAIMRNGIVVAETSVTMNTETGAFPARLIVLTYPLTGRVDTIARYSTGYVPYRSTNSYGFLGVLAGSEGDWAVAGDSLLVVVSGEPSMLRWWNADENDFAQAGQMELPVRPEAFTPDDARDLLEKTNDRRRAAGTPLLPGSVRLDPPSYWGQVKQLVISDDHECWIQWDRPRSSEDDEWFRADLKRQQLERIRLPPGFELLAAAGRNLYGFVFSEYDVPLLTVLRLRQEKP